MRTALFWVITQGVAVFITDVSGNTYRVPSSRYRPLKKGPIGCPETSVRNYHYTLRNSSEERSSLLLGGGSLKSQELRNFDCNWRAKDFR